MDLERTLLLLLSSLSSTSGGISRGSTAPNSRGTTSGADGHEQVLDVLTLEGLGEEGSPDRLTINIGGLDKVGDLVSLYDESLVSCCSLIPQLPHPAAISVMAEYGRIQNDEIKKKILPP